MGAVTVHKKTAVVKKAAVETQKTGGFAAATSLLPTVLGTVTSVIQLKKAQQELSADCAPTSSEISLVNDLVKEWAKVGDTSAEDAVSGWDECSGGSYQEEMDLDGEKSCYVAFDSEGMIWHKYPKADSAKVNKKIYSNVYDVFEKIPFGVEDYTKSEASRVQSLIAKMERCAPSKINAKKRELWGAFLTSTVTQVGTGAGVAGVGDIMQVAGQLSGSGGVSNMLGQFGGLATQMMDK